MVTTTHRGWWPALEPALLAFAVVVCGGVSLLALSHAAASDCGHRCAATHSSYWTTAATDPDPLDDGDDDDAPDAFVVLPVVLTSDGGFGRPLFQTEFDRSSTLRIEQLAPRGPPNRTRTAHHFTSPLQEVLFAAAAPGSRHWTAASHDSVDDGDDDADDDDDDGDADDVAGAIAALPTRQTDNDSHHPVIATQFAVALTRRAENLAPRGPPVDRPLPARPAQASALNPQDPSDVDVNDDDDDDDDAGEGHGFAVAVTRGADSILIVSNVDHRSSFASHDHSLRAPPQ